MKWQYFTGLRYIKTNRYSHEKRMVEFNKINEINKMVMTNERGQNTHSKGEWVKSTPFTKQ